MTATLRQKRASSRHRYFDSAFVAIPTFVICARCSVSIRLTNFCTGRSRSGRMTIATSGFARFNSASRALSVAGSISSLFNLIAFVAIDGDRLHLRRIDRRVRRAARGMTRFTLFSSSGVVIMKMIRSTNARSSSGVMLISESVERLCVANSGASCQFRLT